MSAQLRAELLKLRTTRTFAALLAGAAALTAFGALTQGLSASVAKLATERTQRDVFSATTSAVFFAALAGILIVTNEHRYGTIRPTLLAQPRRRVVLTAKLAAAAVVATALAVVCAGVAFGVGLVMLRVRDVDVALSTGHTLTLVLGGLAASAISAAAGVAIGELIRNQTGAIVAFAAYAFILDALLFAAAPSVGRFLPGKAGDGLAGRPTEHLLAPGAGAAVLFAWTLAFVVWALWRTDRVDV